MTTSPALPARQAIAVFLAFALAYFLSACLRAITATLSPTLSQEFGLQARDLGLLAGGYFLGFSLTQLPLGQWLDRHGPRRVTLGFLGLAVLGAVAFAVADRFAGLLAARVLTGMGLSACLMAPLTGFRRWLSPAAQLRANSWMLMTGSLGMLASTLPVQWLMPVLGWRGVFLALAVLLVGVMGVLFWLVPRWAQLPAAEGAPAVPAGYRAVWRSRFFLRMVPLGFFCYGGMVAMQTLWAGPWMVRVAGYSSEQAAAGLFWLNGCMLLTFWAWGMLNPWLARQGFSAPWLIARGLPLSLLVLVWNIASGAGTGWGGWALYCTSLTVVSLSQPAVALALPPALAGRALSAYNLVIFSGVFVVQWGIGLLIDGMRALGWAEAAAFQGAMSVYLVLCVAAYGWFLLFRADGRAPGPQRQAAQEAR
jgi:MFS family permease